MSKKIIVSFEAISMNELIQDILGFLQGDLGFGIDRKRPVQNPATEQAAPAEANGAGKK